MEGEEGRIATAGELVRGWIERAGESMVQHSCLRTLAVQTKEFESVYHACIKFVHVEPETICVMQIEVQIITVRANPSGSST